MAPQRRFSYSGGGGRRSNSESSRVLSAYPMGGSFGIDDYFLETDGDEADDEFDQLTTSVDVEKSHCLYVKVSLSRGKPLPKFCTKKYSNSKMPLRTGKVDF